MQASRRFVLFGKTALEFLIAADLRFFDVNFFGFLIAFFVNRKSLLFGEFFGDLEGETEGIVQTERRFSGEQVALQVRNDFIEFSQTVRKGPGEFFFFFIEFVVDLLFVLFDLFVGVLIFFHVGRRDLRKAAFGKSERSAETHGAADQSS